MRNHVLEGIYRDVKMFTISVQFRTQFDICERHGSAPIMHALGKCLQLLLDSCLIIEYLKVLAKHCFDVVAGML